MNCIGYIQKNNLLVIYRRIIFLIEDSSINFSLFRTSDFHSTIHKLCHSRNVYDFKINITPTKHA